MKRYIVILGLLLGFVFVVSVTANPAGGGEEPRTIYVFGDSWADQMTASYGTFDQELVDRGYDSFVTLEMWAVSGSTMDGWANDDPCDTGCPGRFTDLLTAITNDPNPDPIIFFTLGGNDILGNGIGQEVYDEIANDLRVVLDAINATRPDTHIIIGAYDISNPNISPVACNILLFAIFGSTDPAVVNPYIIQMYTNHESVAVDYENVAVVNTNGTLQGMPGNPDITQWSPVEYIADCIHLNGSGYDLYLDVIFDNALDDLLVVEPAPIEVYLPILQNN